MGPVIADALITAGLVVALGAGLYKLYLDARGSPVHRVFGLSPREYELLGSDLGRRATPQYLSGHGLTGAPDAVFRRRGSQRYVVGEYKSGRAPRGGRRRDRYQLLLYLGLMAEGRGVHQVTGVLRYRNRTVAVEPDPGLFTRLVALREEVLAAQAKGRPIDERPLAKR